jgi:hypothetical protein
LSSLYEIDGHNFSLYQLNSAITYTGQFNRIQIQMMQTKIQKA